MKKKLGPRRQREEFQKKVVDLLKEDGPLTGREVEQRLGVKGAWIGCLDMARLGIIREQTSTRKCAVAGNNSIVWEVPYGRNA